MISKILSSSKMSDFRSLPKPTGDIRTEEAGHELGGLLSTSQ